jgi:hypothetical protein
MTDIEQKALALLGEVSPYKCEKVDHAHHAYLCAALRLSVERHEAFRQEVSKLAQIVVSGASPDMLAPLIIPAPKPDPLVDAMNDIGIGVYENIKTEYADTLRADLVRRFRSALDARGFEIREKGQ